jgi:hypothetical protein
MYCIRIFIHTGPTPVPRAARAGIADGSRCEERGVWTRMARYMRGARGLEIYEKDEGETLNGSFTPSPPHNTVH